MQSRGGGVIINIASNAGHRVQNAYGVTKLAVRGLTQAFARDFGPDGTRVNAISPGFITTENAVSLYGEDHNNQQISDQLVKRVGTMQDVVSAMLYLSSDGASFVTGQTLLVNGGRDLYV
jgi:3-oxoacyl-[acyl-carrier protein] reductase